MLTTADVEAPSRAETPVRAWITLKLACELMGTYPARVAELVQAGCVRTMKPPGKSHRRYALADVETLVAESTK
jgi:hypothetical protein